MAKKMCISMKLRQVTLEIEGHMFDPELPKGCLGAMYVFESKKAAREFDKTAKLVEVAFDSPESP